MKKTKLRLGISACLLGERVRYDGGHKLDRLIAEVFGPFVEWVPVCPEAECGLGVPREPMRLEGDPASPRLITVRTRLDHTARILAWARQRVAELERECLCGFILKSKSPSCGLRRVPVYPERGEPSMAGIGLFARTLIERLPLLPIEDDRRLHYPRLREKFIEHALSISERGRLDFHAAAVRLRKRLGH
ncbi:MAG: DUF523 domain-containing protein [Planctomycetes bacterium]|nr:DUF523 domain-containing protein [Planctomycetota bacterium]